MFKRDLAASLLVLSLLTGCGQAPDDQSSDTASRNVTSIKIRNEWQEKLVKLNANDRNLTLRRAINDGDGLCPKISGSKFQRDFKNMAMWVAHCSNGDWAIFIAPSGDTQSRACKDIPKLNAQNKGLNLPACEPRPFDPLAPTTRPGWPEPAPPPRPLDRL